MYFVHFLNKKLYMDTTRCLFCLLKLLLKSAFKIFMYFAVIIFISQKGEFYSDFQTWKTIYTVEGSLSVFLLRQC